MAHAVPEGHAGILIVAVDAVYFVHQELQVAGVFALEKGHDHAVEHRMQVFHPVVGLGNAGYAVFGSHAHEQFSFRPHDVHGGNGYRGGNLPVQVEQRRCIGKATRGGNR